jgi:hypothetical protein
MKAYQVKTKDSNTLGDVKTSRVYRVKLFFLGSVNGTQLPR